MMLTPRSWKRESRLLLIAVELSQAEDASSADVFTVDFLLQHPSLLRSFARRGARSLPPAAEPSASETESSEEAFLRWKRSVGAQILTPMLGRLIARGLLSLSSQGRLAISPRGRQIADELREGLRPREQARLNIVAEEVRADEQGARVWLRDALAEEMN